MWLNSSTDRNSPLPTASMWIKGERGLMIWSPLFLNGQQIATTDDMGSEIGTAAVPQQSSNKKKLTAGNCLILRGISSDTQQPRRAERCRDAQMMKDTPEITL